MNYFREGFGLITENDPNTENCSLFYAEYLTLKEEVTEEDKEFFVNNMKLKLNDRGLYNRRSIETVPIRSVSKDEILGFLVASKILNTDHKDIIWKHLITHFGSYNNTGRFTEALPFNPANFYAWGQLVDSKLSYLFLPFFIVNLIIAANKKKEDTSSKIMYWLIFKNIKETNINRLLKNYFEKKMKAMYSDNYVKDLMDIYFWMEDKINFPIFKELNNAE